MHQIYAQRTTLLDERACYQHLRRRKKCWELATAESVTAKDSNHVNTFSLDFAFSPLIARGNVSNANILSLIAFIISYCLFADELNIQQSLLDRATVVLIIILVNKTQLLLISGDVARLTPSTLLARFIPITKIRDPLLKKNAAKSRILLACADGRIRQCYPTILLLTGVKKNCYCTRYTRTEQFTQLQQERCLNKGHDDFHYNFNIHVSLATDTLHLLLKGLVIKMLDFMQDILDDIYPSSRKTWDNSTTLVMHSTSLKRFNNKRAFTELVAVVSLLFISKAPFALHFIRAVCDLVTLAQYKSYDEDTLAYIQGALERMNIFKEEFRVYRRTLGEEKNFNYSNICTKANSEAYYITMVKQFYSITNKKEYILQICLHNSQRTALLAADYATVVKQSQLSTTPHLTKLPLSEVAVNIAISNFTHAAARFSGKRHNDSKYCDKEVVRCRRDYVWVQEFKHRDNRRQSRTVTDDRKHMAYIRAFSEVLLFNNNRQIDNTTRMLSTLQAFKFYNLSTIIRLVHLVPRNLPNSTTRTTMSYYVNNYIN
ncbi:hypothetical protein HBI39_204700 [Parastagonospora nodorum]|nr:hypothetical protein HBI39_204700 [Parastagonospora nodorum]